MTTTPKPTEADIKKARAVNTGWTKQHIKAIAQARREGAVAEREACADIADNCGVYPELNVSDGGPNWLKHAHRIAREIRQRGNSND